MVDVNGDLLNLFLMDLLQIVPAYDKLCQIFCFEVMFKFYNAFEEHEEVVY